MKTVKECISEALVKGKLKQYTKISYNKEYVDLGLPSGLLWATCNLGANKPEEYGNYYAWGEIESKESFDLKNYNNINFSEYELEDNMDAATQQLGNGWRIPDAEMFSELILYTQQKSTNINGIDCIVLTSDINGKTLCIPLAGFKQIDEFADVDYIGNYWTKETHRIKGYARTFMFSRHRCVDDYMYRYYGASIRPVKTK